MNGGKTTRPLSERLALRPKEAAELIGVSERTFRALLPYIPHVRLGGAVLVPRDLLLKWLHERAVAPGTEEDRIVEEMLRDGAPRRNRS